MIMIILGIRKSIAIITMLISTSVTFAQPVKVFILAGQSNMQGHCFIEPTDAHITKNGGMGTLRYMIDHDSLKIYGGLTDATTGWVTRNDVWLHYDRGGTNGVVVGDLTVGAGAADDKIGPEFGFGIQVGDYYQNQVLLIKAAIGGTSLNTAWQPPSVGGPGPQFLRMDSIVTAVLADIKAVFPEYADQGFEMAGFGWHQGWNDANADDVAMAYEANLVAFIKDVRLEFNAPNMPFVVGVSGHNGWVRGPGFRGRIWDYLQPAQLAVSDDAKYPDFAGNVASAETRDFWFEADQSPSSSPSHYNRNGETMFKIGDAMGKEMVDLLKVLDPNTGIEIGNSGQKSFNILGNNLTMIEKGDHTISLFNLNGKLIFRTTGQENQSYLLSQISEGGMFFVSIKTSSGNYQQKILIH